MDSPGAREDIGPLTVTATAAHGVVWIVVRGEVDLANREQLRTGLAAVELGRASLVYLDLRLLSFCDSAGCGILVRFERQATAAGDVPWSGVTPRSGS
jgi:anti-anti-sigma factor